MLGQWFSVSNYTRTHMPIHIYALPKSCVLLPTSTTWRKLQCDLAVQTLTPEPVSPESVIQVNSVVKLRSELPAVILPWAMNAPLWWSDIIAQMDRFSKKILSDFLFQTGFVFPVPCSGAHTTDLCKDLLVRMHITQRKPWSIIHFSHWSHAHSTQMPLSWPQICY